MQSITALIETVLLLQHNTATSVGLSEIPFSGQILTY